MFWRGYRNLFPNPAYKRTGRIDGKTGQDGKIDCGAILSEGDFTFPILSSFCGFRVPFNPATTNVQQIKGHWKVGDGDRSLFDFGTNKTEADQAPAIIKKYGFAYSCMMALRVASILFICADKQATAAIGAPRFPLPTLVFSTAYK
jgi:hypothetical protein